MNTLGVSAARRLTRDTAGWMRCSRASKSSPLPSASGMTISPSIDDVVGQGRARAPGGARGSSG